MTIRSPKDRMKTIRTSTYNRLLQIPVTRPSIHLPRSPNLRRLAPQVRDG